MHDKGPIEKHSRILTDQSDVFCLLAWWSPPWFGRCQNRVREFLWSPIKIALLALRSSTVFGCQRFHFPTGYGDFSSCFHETETSLPSNVKIKSPFNLPLGKTGEMLRDLLCFNPSAVIQYASATFGNLASSFASWWCFLLPGPRLPHADRKPP